MGCAKLIGQSTLSERTRLNREGMSRTVSIIPLSGEVDSMVNVSELTLAVVRFEGAQDTLALTKR